MRHSIVKSVFKKEMIDILRDKKTLFMTALLPILLYPILILLITYIMTLSNQTMAQKTLNIAFDHEPSAVLREKIEGLSKEEGQLNIVETTDYEKDIKEGKISAYIESEEQGTGIHYTIYINSSMEDDTEASSRLEDIMKACQEEETEKRIEESGLDKKYILEPITYTVKDIAEKEQILGFVLGQVLPFILIIGILMGAIYPAIDIMAGEKERGTLETLLTLPISNLELVMGKYLAVSACAITSALLNLLSIGLSIGLLLLNVSEIADLSQGNINFGRLGLPLVITFVCIALFTLVISAVSMCICSLVKSFKEAQNAVTPLMLVAMVLSYASMVPTLELTSLTATIPVVNIALLIKSVLTFKYDMALLLIVLISNIGFAMIAVWVLSKLFNSEEILFGTGRGFSFFEKRSNIKKGTLPSFSDGLITYAFVLLIFLYICSYLQMKYKMVGLTLTEFIIFSIPVLLSIYIKTDFKKVYSIRPVKIVDGIGAVVMWLGTAIISILTINILLSWFPQNIEALNEMQNAIFGEHGLAVKLLVIAILPAICEETLFRGFLQAAFTGENHPVRGILWSGILFGILHMSLIKLLPITLLGIVIGYTVYKTKSIFAGMLIHFLNNGLSVVISHEGIWIAQKMAQLEEQLKQINALQILGGYIVGIVIALVGYMLLNRGKENNVMV